MDMRGSRYVSCASYVDFSTVRMTSPTCEELGIPTEVGEEAGAVYSPFFTPRVIHNPSLHLDGLRYEAEAHKISDPYSKISDPYSPLCMIPLPGNLALHASAEPSFIRKRNERERDRVRCVNDGFARLKKHLPPGFTGKRLSKVDTLKGAIAYIRQLQKLLADNPPPPHPRRNDDDDDDDDDDDRTRKRSRTTRTIPSCDISNMCPRTREGEERDGRRRCDDGCSVWSQQFSSMSGSGLCESSNDEKDDDGDETAECCMKKRQRIG